MAATGNVKISELTNHPRAAIDGNELIPLSWAASGGTSYESYKMKAKEFISYTGEMLGIYSGFNEETGEPIPGPIDTYLYSYGREISYLDRDLGQYDGGLDGNFCTYHSIGPLTVEFYNSYIYKDGTRGTAGASGWAISQPVNVKQGTLYLLQVPVTTQVNQNWCMFAKRHVHTYYPITGYQEVETADGSYVMEPIYGDATTTIVYEPRSFHYDKFTDTSHTGYGIPKSGYVIFYAPEDEQIVICAPNASITGKMLYASHYAVFGEIAEKFLGATSDISQVISESIASLDARVSTLEDNSGSFSDITAYNAEFRNMPTFRGAPLITISDHEPQSTNYCVDENGAYITDPSGLATNHAPDWVNFPGQMWVVPDVNGAGGNAWMGFEAGTATWKQMSHS